MLNAQIIGLKPVFPFHVQRRSWRCAASASSRLISSGPDSSSRTLQKVFAHFSSKDCKRFLYTFHQKIAKDFLHTFHQKIAKGFVHFSSKDCKRFFAHFSSKDCKRFYCTLFIKRLQMVFLHSCWQIFMKILTKAQERVAGAV